jgi:hypothetical protein
MMKGSLVHPIIDLGLRRITQGFGENPAMYERFGLKGHPGIDYGVSAGTPIRAVATGVAKEVFNDPTGYGLYIKLVHEWGESLYAHLSVQMVQLQERVSAGQVIGISGNTGNSTGAHFHFGLRVDPYSRDDGYKGFTDPLPYLRADGQPEEIGLLARIITAEARGEPIVGKLAVAWVVMNRVARKNRWGDTITQVITQPYQFAQPAVQVNEVALAVAQLVVAGYTKDPVEGATHFHATSVTPSWAPKIQRIRQIGRHIFYKEL